MQLLVRRANPWGMFIITVDGRCVFLADFLGAEKIILFGMDLGGRIVLIHLRPVSYRQQNCAVDVLIKHIQTVVSNFLKTSDLT